MFFLKFKSDNVVFFKKKTAVQRRIYFDKHNKKSVKAYRPYYYNK